MTRMIEVSEDALDSIKKMAEQVREERDELLTALQNLLDSADYKSEYMGAGWSLPQHVARKLIAKCTKEPEVMQTK